MVIDCITIHYVPCPDVFCNDSADWTPSSLRACCEGTTWGGKSSGHAEGGAGADHGACWLLHYQGYH